MLRPLAAIAVAALLTGAPATANPAPARDVTLMT
jgi:hypothetical protein